VGVGDLLPGEMKLRPLAPNPSREFTNVRFALAHEADVTLAVYDISGREMIELADGKWPAGEHSIKWSFTNGTGQPVPAGLYFVRLQAGGQVLMQRVIRLN
jgi:flagellar hook assembly protein FlgD